MCASFQEDDQNVTSSNLTRESEKARNLKNEAEAYSGVLKEIINSVSRAQVPAFT